MPSTRIRAWRAYRTNQRRNIRACAEAGVNVYCPDCGGDLTLRVRLRVQVPTTDDGAVELACEECRRFSPPVTIENEELHRLRLRRLASAILTV